MTIAACYVSTEGIVFGADSTTTITMSIPGGPTVSRYYDYAQKIFEVGEASTLGVVTWAMGGLPERSHRFLIAQFADRIRTGAPLPNMETVAREWAEFYWDAYSRAFPAEIARAQTLRSGNPAPGSAEETELFGLLQGLTIGFCFGGNLYHDRTPRAFEIIFSPDLPGAPTPQSLQVGLIRYWGCPNLMERLVYGIDQRVFDAILRSPHWGGNQQDLISLIQPAMLRTITLLPIREAIDWVHASVYATIKMMRYSQLDPLCGGPVEVAVITADRPFRWVRHKTLDAAIPTTSG